MATNEGGTAKRRAAAPSSRTASRSVAAQPAYVLHQHDWSESSLIVELFTRAQGRLVVAAKGAKRPSSQLRSVLLPFQPIQVLLGKTPLDEQAEVLNLRSAEWLGGQPLLGPAAMLPGFYLNELLLKLLARQDPHPVLFDAYAETLAALAREDAEGLSLRAFELLLLRELGVLPELNVVTQTAQALLPAGRYTLHAEQGLVETGGAGVPGADWAAMAAAMAHGAPEALRAACRPVAAALRVPLRGMLQYHLGHSKLRTRQVRQDLQRLAESPFRAIAT